MSEAKFTKGPWYVAGSLGHGILIRSASASREQIAVIYGSSVNPSGPFNAYMAAAAPAMYDALKWCINHLKQIEAEQFPDLPEEMRAFNSRRNAEIALASAEGRDA